SLAAGFLTGKYRSEDDLNKSARGEGVRKYLDDKGLNILKALDEISTRLETTQASVALAWLLANPLVTAPIVSATSESQLKTLFAAPELKLSSEDVELLNKVSQY
ncbi:aldo/keto reductase, partial [Chryseobacterium indoltheticum]|uniref:aldo/keto reductase n=1 Tax=Chryseobacterium indoltheticum TaxID=254 RepID=UPI0028E40583